MTAVQVGGSQLSRRTVLTAMAAAGLSMTGLAACGARSDGGGSNSGGGSGSGGKDAVVLAVPLSSPEDRSFLNDWLPKFTKQTGVSVTQRTYPDKQYAQALQQLFTSGHEPDAFRETGLGLNMQTDYGNGWLRSLNDYPAVTDLLTKYYPDAMKDPNSSGLHIDGKIYGVPAYQNTTWNAARLLTYNSKLLDQYGVDPPQTWNDLAEGAKKITTDSKGEVYGLAFQGGTALDIPIAALVSESGPLTATGAGFPINYRTGKSDAAGDQLSSIVAFWRDLVKAGALTPGWETLGTPDWWRLAATGKIAMAMTNPWSALNIRKLNKDVALHYLRPPVPDTGRASYRTFGGPLPALLIPHYGISKASKNPEDAAKLIAFMSSLDVDKDHYKRTGIPGPLADQYSDELDPDNKAMLALEGPKQRRKAPNPTIRFADAFDLVVAIQKRSPQPGLGPLMIEAIGGKVDYKTEAAKFDSAFNAVVAEEISKAGAPANVFTYDDWDPMHDYTTRK